MRSQYPELRRELLNPLAARYGLTYDQEVLVPGDAPEARAFQLVVYGADLLGQFIYKDKGYFPSMNRGVRRRGARLMRRKFASDDGRQAAVFLSQALGVFLHEIVARAGKPREAQLQLRLREFIQRYYPLDPESTVALERFRSEYRTLDTHEMRKEVVAGVEGTGYHMALLNPDRLNGGNPDDDPNLVEAQEQYASRYLRRMSEMYAIELTIGADEYSRIARELVMPTSTGDYAVIAYDHLSLRWWADVADLWHDTAQVTVPLLSNN